MSVRCQDFHVFLLWATSEFWMFENKEQKMAELSLWFKNSFAIMMEELCTVVVWGKAADSESGFSSVGRNNGNERHINENVL